MPQSRVEGYSVASPWRGAPAVSHVSGAAGCTSECVEREHATRWLRRDKGSAQLLIHIDVTLLPRVREQSEHLPRDRHGTVR